MEEGCEVHFVFFVLLVPCKAAQWRQWMKSGELGVYYRDGEMMCDTVSGPAVVRDTDWVVHYKTGEVYVIQDEVFVKMSQPVI